MRLILRLKIQKPVGKTHGFPQKACGISWIYKSTGYRRLFTRPQGQKYLWFSDHVLILRDFPYNMYEYLARTKNMNIYVPSKVVVLINCHLKTCFIYSTD